MGQYNILLLYKLKILQCYGDTTERLKKFPLTHQESGHKQITPNYNKIIGIPIGIYGM